MPELTKEEKLKLIEKLPQRLQDFLYSEDTGAFLLYLGNKYKLLDEKVSALSKIVGDIILKITPITNLAQEIVNKVISDPQIAMAIAQELNSGLLMPALTPAPTIPTTPTVPKSVAPIVKPQIPDTKYQIPNTDRYREPMTTGPEIVDLRKTPPPPMPMPVTTAPVPPRPLTFTKPVEPPAVSKVEPPKPTPLIEAEPHKKIEPPVMSPSTPFRTSQVGPQYIIRPPGLVPTDLPHDVLDLRKDKGEF